MTSGRRRLVAGNWKMQLTAAAAIALARSVAEAAVAAPEPEVAVFPSFVHLSVVRDALRGSTVGLGAQTCHDRPHGAHTGEVAAEMLADLGVRYVLCGHSERRQAGETDAMVGARVQAVLRAGLRPLLCVGESLEERASGRADDVLRRQTIAALDGVSPDDVSRLDVAYEPVWAIGTGRTATADDAASCHRTVRDVLVRRFGAAGAVPRILYGGSVKPSNAAALLAPEGIDGVLVGGASLEASGFRAILEAAGASPGRTTGS